jgi:uncharacterized membrane protein
MTGPSPYRPPQAPVADQERPRGSPVKGMIYGLLVDLGGTTVSSLALVFIWTIWLAMSGLEAEAIEQSLQNLEPLSPISVIGSVMGCGLSFLGGYVCARVARETELRCAAVVAVVSATVSLAMGSSLPLELNLLFCLLTAGLVMLGGWLGERRNRRRQWAGISAD